MSTAHIKTTALEVPAGNSPRHSKNMTALECRVCGGKGLISGTPTLALRWCEMAGWHAGCAAPSDTPTR